MRAGEIRAGDFEALADAIYMALPFEGGTYEAAAENAAAKVIADGWMIRAAAGDAQAREAELVSEPLRRRLREAEAERDDLESRLADLLCDLTDGRMSKTNYDVRTMVQEVEAAFERHDAEDRGELAAEIARLKAERNGLWNRMVALADEMRAQHGQTWNSVAGQRIINALTKGEGDD